MKGLKKALKIVGIGFAALVVLTIVIGIFAGGSDSAQETSKQQTKESTETESGEEGKEMAYESDDHIQEHAGTTDVEGYLDTLYSTEDGDNIVSLYMDDKGSLCVWSGSTSTEEEYYSRTYESYTVEDGTLYGRTGADTDEFIFMEDGYVDVLLSGYGSTHYQSYMCEEAYFSGGGLSN